MNLYETLYDLIVTYIFAGQGVENGILTDQMQHLVAVLVSTCGWLFCIAIPFIVVYWFIKVITTGFGRW